MTHSNSNLNLSSQIKGGSSLLLQSNNNQAASVSHSPSPYNYEQPKIQSQLSMNNPTSVNRLDFNKHVVSHSGAQNILQNGANSLMLMNQEPSIVT